MTNIILKAFRKKTAVVAIVLGAFGISQTFTPTIYRSVYADQVSPCDRFLQTITAFPQATDEVAALQKFAEKHGLPTQVLNVGPDIKPIKRFFVALDITKPDVVADYLQTFNLDTPTGANTGGTLALEFQHEIPNAYVTGVLRPGADPVDKIYRWGRPDLQRDQWFQTWVVQGRGGVAANAKPIFGYGYLIGIDQAELLNVKHFLANPAERAACKSDNCVAWTSSIELGKTAAGTSDEDRKFLFSELGMSRSMAHFEINRRLMRAANGRNSAVVVFVNGDAGIQAFNQDLPAHLPPDPKIPYTQIFRNLQFPDDSAVMQAIAQIPDGSKVFIPIAAGASPTGVQALIQASAKMVAGVDVHMLVNGVSEAILKKGVETEDHKFRIHALFLGGNLRKLNDEGKVSVIPGYLSDFVRHVKDPDQTDFDYGAIIVRVSPPDAAGRYSLGPNNDMIMDIIKARKGIKVIAEVNPNVPFTTGQNFLTDKQITAKFSENTELAGPAVVPFTPVEATIGTNLASLTTDNSYIQMGIGNIFAGLPQALRSAGRKNFKVFTEMFGDPLMQLMQFGIATEAATGFAFGSSNLYKWLGGNANVTFVTTAQVNDPAKVAAKNNFFAVNTALQVNLRGDANAEIGPNGSRISSPGGQVEFMSGASRSKGGHAVIAIRSTAKNGTMSSISLDLYGGNVTTPNQMVTDIVTEYGVARLRGQSEANRALAIIRVAHPNFRKELAEGAVAQKLISPAQAKEFTGE